MTYREAFVAASRRLAAADHPTDTPDLDARVLLAQASGLNHAGLLARWPDPLPAAAAEAFEAALGRRLAGEPVAWIVGTKEFLGLDFTVVPGLLVPRADTETLVEAGLDVLADELADRPRPRVADVCTGTGCVGVGLAALADRPLDAWAGDLSPLAVATARANAARLLRPPRALTVVESDLLGALAGPFDLILSNPPYLTPEETQSRVGPGGWLEPALALDGGGLDGLDLIRRLVTQAFERLSPGGWLFLEAGGPQSPAIAGLLADAGFTSIRVRQDLAGLDRVTGGRRP